jgi:hypothetical protein
MIVTDIIYGFFYFCHHATPIIILISIIPPFCTMTRGRDKGTGILSSFWEILWGKFQVKSVIF